MRTKLTLVAALAGTLSAPGLQAQTVDASSYPFSSTTGVALEDMSSGTTLLVAANTDDTNSVLAPIGFDFYLATARQTQFGVNGNGIARLGLASTGTPFANALNNVSNAPKLAPFWDDLCVGPNGLVHYKVVGTAPARKLVVEWLNMRGRGAAGCGANGTGTFQLWLFEGTGVIEYVYGADPVVQAVDAGYTIGLQSGAATSFGSVTAVGPTVSYAVSNNAQVSVIPSGTAYLFTPPVPAAPTGLSFSAVTATGMTLNWTDSTNESLYRIEMSTDGTNYAFFSGPAAGSTSQVVGSLSASTTYFWRVYAVSSGALSTALAGSQATNAPGNVSSTGGGGLWSAPATWAGSVVPTGSDNVTIGDGATVTIDTAASALSLTIGQGGAAAVLQYEAATARTLTVGFDVTIASNGTLRSSTTGTVTAHALSLAGNLTNNGALDFSTNADTAGAGITFTGAANRTFGGAGVPTDVRTITVNKGTSSVSTVELLAPNFTVRGSTVGVGGFLTITNGTLKLSGSFAMTNRVFATATYVIPATGGFWLNNSNFVVAGQPGVTTCANNGLLRLTQGTYNIGVTGADGMGGGTGAQFIIEGGTINATRIDPQNPVSFNMSAGTVNVGVVPNSRTNFGTFELLSATSSFTMSGGTFNLIQAATGAIPIDWQVLSAPFTFTGGVVNVGTAATATNFNFRLRGNLPNLVVDNTTNAKTATFTAQTIISGNVTINPGTTYDLNGFLVALRGSTLTNNGTVTGTTAGSRFYFLGGGSAQSYGGSGIVTAPLVSVEFDNALGVTFAPAISQVVASRMILFSGNVTGANHLTLGNGAATSGTVQIGNTTTPTAAGVLDLPPTFNAGTGGYIYSYLRTATPRLMGNEMFPGHVLTSLTIDSQANDVTAPGLPDFGLTSTGTALTLASGRLVMNGASLAVTAPTGVVARTTGFVTGNLQLPYAAAAVSKPFHVGTANGYSPVTVNLTAAAAFPTQFAVAAVQGPEPGIAPTTTALARHWTLTAPAGTTGDLTFTYLDPPDVPGTATEANFLLYRNDTGVYTNVPATINTVANTALAGGVTQFSNWTLAELTDLSITNTDGVPSATAGTNTIYTITASNAGPAAVAAAAILDTFPGACSAVSYTATATGGATGFTASGVGNINDATVNLPVGSSVTYLATCSISPAASGTLDNTATISSNSSESSTANNSATDSDTLGDSADLGITKTDGVNTVIAGGSLTYTITASNAGPSSAPGATVADTFPAPLTCTWTCLGAGGGTCTAAGAGNINDGVGLPAGGSVTYTASCSVSASSSGTLSNTATVAAPVGVSDPNPDNDSATDDDTTISGLVDLAITATDGVTVAQAGRFVTYTVTASNSGPGNAPLSTVSDGFPAACTSVTWTCSASGGAVCAAATGTFAIGDVLNLPAGSSVTYVAVCSVAANATGTLANTATIAASASVTDATPGNNSATDTDTVAQLSDVALGMSVDNATPTTGTNVTFTVTATNNGPSPATSVQVSDLLPPGLGFVSSLPSAGTYSSASGLWSIGMLNNAASATLQLTAQVNRPEGLHNQATVVANGSSDSSTSNNSALAGVNALAYADVQLAQTISTPTALVGTDVTFTLTVRNAGSAAATGVVVSDTLPAGLTLISSNASQGTYSSPTWTVGTLASGASATLDIVANVTLAGRLSNVATKTQTESDPIPANDSASATINSNAEADLSLGKTASQEPVAQGSSFTYTVVVANNGPAVATGVVMTDDRSAVGVALNTATASQGSCSGTTFVTCTLGSIAPGGVATVLLNVTKTASGSIVNTANVSGNETDPNSANNSSGETTTPVELMSFEVQ